ncbi:sodium/proline symporter PutP [Paenibacillus sp. JX-17]|uniref:Sodium/proline symporter n=1 Tax=Paenibacillus lacisoli TaxID=3064525 RepID=A0ABT9CH50_9BACL|nr:sodium/proline symporter PutP [Paenibacillus sp. JX-17]MDO7907974.1 sodium/proline symporter PutP [Paenibacillus sp. JX-17]
MNQPFGTYLTLGIYFIGMLVIGWYAFRKSTGDLEGYMLGGRGVGPFVTALSAGAADMSGWMLMGLPGSVFVKGISGMWIVVGLSLGAYLNYVYVAPRLRIYTKIAQDAITIPDFFENRFMDRSRLLKLISAAVILIFFTFYTSSGMVSGGRFFESAFGMDYRFGLFLVTSIVIAYTLFGGYLAVSLTDSVQGLIMFAALVAIPSVAIYHLGGFKASFDIVNQLDPAHFNLFQGVQTAGILSLLAWGLGYFGQPHILVRFMSITSARELKTARRIGISWMVIGLLGASLIGLAGYAYVNVNLLELSDPETIFILFANILFNPYITGILLAALLAAVMSTISSQLLVTASALTEDFYRTFLRRGASNRELVLIGRLSVLLIAVIALIMSYTPNDTILNLVGYAWAGFGSSFGPAVLLSLFWKRMTSWGAIAGIVSGAVGVIVWVALGLSDMLYEMIPAFCASLLAIVVVSLLTSAPQQQVLDEFDQARQELKERA